MRFENMSIREIGDNLIYELAKASTFEDKEAIYNDLEETLIKYSPEVTPEEIQQIIKHNFYNFDLLAGYSEPVDMVEYLQFLAWENDKYCLYETLSQLFGLCNGKLKGATNK